MKAKRRRMKAAERLLFTMRIYRGYKIESRGPGGCIFDALEAVAPKIAKRVRETDGDWDQVYREFFPDAEDGLS